MRLHNYFILLLLLVPLMSFNPENAKGLFLEGAEIGVIWPAGPDGTISIPVCFRPIGTQSHDRQNNPYQVGYFHDETSGSYVDRYNNEEWLEKRAIVRDALESAWPKWTKIIFTGWGDCPANITKGIFVDLIRSTTNNFGGDSMPRGYHSTGVKVWLRMDTADQRLLRSVIIHEFGHVLNFHHEMDRPDAKYSNGQQICTDGPVEYLNGSYLTPYYDDISIMNYCGPPNRNGLSVGDITGAQKVYGMSSEAKWLHSLSSLSLLAM